MKIEIKYTPYPWYSIFRDMRYQATYFSSRQKEKGPLKVVCGYGKTEEAAIKDLLNKMVEAKTTEYPKEIEVDFT